MSDSECKHYFVTSDSKTLLEIVRQRNDINWNPKWFRPKICDDCKKRVRCCESLESYYEVF